MKCLSDVRVSSRRSPVWLLYKGRGEEAKRVLEKLRSNRSPLEIEAELQEMQTMADQNNVKITWRYVSAIFRGTNLKRTLTSLGVCSFSAAQGVYTLVNMKMYPAERHVI